MGKRLRLCWWVTVCLYKGGGERKRGRGRGRVGLLGVFYIIVLREE